MRQFSAENHFFLLQFKLSNNLYFTSQVKIALISGSVNIINILQAYFLNSLTLKIDRKINV
jgi:hypothetical protein